MLFRSVIFFGSLKSEALGRRAAFPLPLVVCVLVFNILNFGTHDLYHITPFAKLDQRQPFDDVSIFDVLFDDLCCCGLDLGVERAVGIDH